MAVASSSSPSRDPRRMKACRSPFTFPDEEEPACSWNFLLRLAVMMSAEMEAAAAAEVPGTPLRCIALRKEKRSESWLWDERIADGGGGGGADDVLGVGEESRSPADDRLPGCPLLLSDIFLGVEVCMALGEDMTVTAAPLILPASDRI